MLFTKLRLSLNTSCTWNTIIVHSKLANYFIAHCLCSLILTYHATVSCRVISGIFTLTCTQEKASTLGVLALQSKEDAGSLRRNTNFLYACSNFIFFLHCFTCMAKNMKTASWAKNISYSLHGACWSDPIAGFGSCLQFFTSSWFVSREA